MSNTDDVQGERRRRKIFRVNRKVIFPPTALTQDIKIANDANAPSRAMQAHKVKPVGKMDVDVEVQADVDEEQELLDERRVKQESGAKKKLKEW